MVVDLEEAGEGHEVGHEAVGLLLVAVACPSHTTLGLEKVPMLVFHSLLVVFHICFLLLQYVRESSDS